MSNRKSGDTNKFIPTGGARRQTTHPSFNANSDYSDVSRGITRQSAAKANEAIRNYSTGRPEPLRQAIIDDEEADQAGFESEEDEIDEDEVDDDDDEEEIINGFQRKARLPESVFVRRNIAQLMTLLDGDYLDVNPSYQRDVVWPKKRMSKLIDSLLENFYVPPVLFNVEQIRGADGKSRFKRTCVDGKQRLTSIRDFMHGRIGCHDCRGITWYYCIERDQIGKPVKKIKRKLLPESIKEEFRKKDLLCCEYKDLSEVQEREIFQRVQLGMALTGAEAFRATSGKWQIYAQQYEREFPRVINLCINRRAMAFRRIMICFAQIYECQDPTSGDGVPRIKHSIKATEKLCKDQDSLNSKTKQHLRFVFETFNKIIYENPEMFEGNSFRSTKTFSPIELVSVCVLISQWGDRRPMGMLKGDISALRDQLRAKHHDLRMSEPCWRTAWEYIEELERYRGTVDCSTSLKRTGRTEQNTDASPYRGSQLDPRSKPGRSARTAPSGNQIESEDPPSYDISTRGPGAISAGWGQEDLASLNNTVIHGRSLMTNTPTPKIEEENNAMFQLNSHLPGIRQPPSNSSRTFSNGQRMVETAIPSALKRANLDFGIERGGINALAAKRARLMGKSGT